MAVISRRAFTLIELLVVVTIIALLVVLIFPSYTIFEARARLATVSDQVGQLFDRSKTMVTSGYAQNANSSTSQAVGLYFSHTNNTIYLFTTTFPVASSGAIFAPENLGQIVDSLPLGSVNVQKITNDSGTELDQASVVFLPPFGTAAIDANNTFPLDDHITSLTLRLAVGSDPTTPLSKELTFYSATNRVEYAH